MGQSCFGMVSLSAPFMAKEPHLKKKKKNLYLFSSLTSNFTFSSSLSLLNVILHHQMLKFITGLFQRESLCFFFHSSYRNT